MPSETQSKLADSFGPPESDGLYSEDYPGPLPGTRCYRGGQLFGGGQVENVPGYHVKLIDGRFLTVRWDSVLDLQAGITVEGLDQVRYS